MTRMHRVVVVVVEEVELIIEPALRLVIELGFEFADDKPRWR